jgi:steroid Delta-isomerase
MDTSILDEHVARFNKGIRTGDYQAMLDAFTADAVMTFEGVPVGPFVGRDAISRAYAQHPPDDEIVILGAPAIEDGTIVADYAWAAAGTRAGRMLLTPADGRVARLTVTFE